MSDSGRRLLLVMRRAPLVRQAAEQRQRLGLAVAPLGPAWCWVEGGIAAWSLLRRRPWLVAVPVALDAPW